MSKHFFIYIFLFISVMFACKKKDAPDEDPSGNPLPIVAPADTSKFYSLLSCLNVYAKNSGSFTATGNLTSAYYSSQPITNEIYSAANLQDMGTVDLNNVTFKNKTTVTNFYYTDSTGTQFSLPHTWMVSGSSAINSFSYSNTSAPPTFTASANIPDSISLSSGFSINIKGTTDCNLIRVFLLGGTGSSIFPNKLFSGSDSLIQFTSSDLQGLTTTATGYLSIQFYRDNYRSIGGKRVNFRTGLQYYNAQLKIKP